MRIKEAADHVGVVTGTLRNWERQGLISGPQRTVLGDRNYSAENILEIQKVIKGKIRGKK